MYRKYRGHVEDGRSNSSTSSHMKENKHPPGSVEDKVARCWETIDNQCLQYSPVPHTSQPGDNTWTTIRVFVSSTFTDCHSEREVLVKQVSTLLCQILRQQLRNTVILFPINSVLMDSSASHYLPYK